MTINQHGSRCSTASSRSSKDCSRSSNAALALKRYLDLTLRGTRKNLADHGVANRGKKGYPLSPYTFDQPDAENSVQRILHTPDGMEDVTRPPDWVNKINSHTVKHNGEAPLFTENFLPSSKEKQVTYSRPLSGISTKSAPVIINGAMYYRQTKKHVYLQASRRPTSAMEDRMTRTAKLRNKHRSEIMSGVPSDSTKDELQRLKEMKPTRQNLNKDLLPIPCHINETPHAFIIGARYNCSNFMDSRSFSRLGLYVPRKNPLGTFLKTYKGANTSLDNGSDSEAFMDQTSVRTGGSIKSRRPSTQPLSDHNGRVYPPRYHRPTIPVPHLRKVVKEAWLNLSDENEKMQASIQNMQISKSQNRSIASHMSSKAQSRNYYSDYVESNHSSHSKKGNARAHRAKSTPAPLAHDTEYRQSVMLHNKNLLNNLHLPKQESETRKRNSLPQHRVAEIY